MSLPAQLTQFNGLINIIVDQIVDEIRASTKEPNPADNELVEMIGDTNRSASKKVNLSTSATVVAIVRQFKSEDLVRRGGNYGRVPPAAAGAGLVHERKRIHPPI